jgi:predicted nucleic acid-binding protein
MRFLLDTNVFREINKTKPDANVTAWLDFVDDADLAISALTVGEVRKGVIKLRARKRDVPTRSKRASARHSTLSASVSCRLHAKLRSFGANFSLKATSTFMTPCWSQPRECTD